jgi:hypothetical protein
LQLGLTPLNLCNDNERVLKRNYRLFVVQWRNPNSIIAKMGAGV